MYGYPSGIQVKNVVEDQKELLSKQIDDVEMVIEERKKELEKLKASFEALLKAGS